MNCLTLALHVEKSYQLMKLLTHGPCEIMVKCYAIKIESFLKNVFFLLLRNPCDDS